MMKQADALLSLEQTTYSLLTTHYLLQLTPYSFFTPSSRYRFTAVPSFAPTAL